MTTAPPRLLAGSTLTFWGAMTGHAWLGLLLGILMEGRSWVGMRWDFKPASYVRAWHLSVLVGALIAGLSWLGGMKVGEIHHLFVWVPAILAPVELAQRYGVATLIPLNTFSFFARRKMLDDEKHGSQVKPHKVNTGYPYIVIVMLATAVSGAKPLYFLVGMMLVFGVILWSNLRGKGLRPRAWIISFGLVIAVSYVSLLGMNWAYNSLTLSRAGEDGRRTFTHETRTSIGKLGRMKLSPHIFWRMQVQHGNQPRLLRTAVYNRYAKARWLHGFDEPETGRRDEFDYLGAEPLPGERDVRIFRETSDAPAPDLSTRANLRITGELPAKIAENPVPVPQGVMAVGDLRELGGDTAIECNSLGTVRLTNQDHSVVEYTVWTGDRDSAEMPPVNKFDLEVPAAELAAVRRIVKQLGLKNIQGTDQKVELIRKFFNEEFQYSTHLRTPPIDRDKRRTAMGIFLETTRSGHCEYFATAAALLLRESGVPARYCVGFSVNEKDKDRDEWVMRGTHSHAWCRVWKGDHWEDVDLTPLGWLEMDSHGTMGWRQKFADWWQRFTEDFLIWRTRESNQAKVTTVVSVVVGLLLAWIGWRLWQSRNRSARKRRKLRKKLPQSAITPVHQLEPWLAKRLGPRPDGMPMSVWLSQAPAGEARDLAQQIGQRHDAWRFDPESDSEEAREHLAALCKQLKRLLKNSPSKGSQNSLTEKTTSEFLSR